ncbi:hypothetical protein LIER_24208 [Lithospermum erythrorhizon]|uniref:Uncharacterized protein n=1 Tax=Lithospermum erythrorhizon TaxID=34254 RepID=A0AAV3R1R1_LITER
MGYSESPHAAAPSWEFPHVPPWCMYLDMWVLPFLWTCFPLPSGLSSAWWRLGGTRLPTLGSLYLTGESTISRNTFPAEVFRGVRGLPPAAARLPQYHGEESRLLCLLPQLHGDSTALQLAHCFFSAWEYGVGLLKIRLDGRYLHGFLPSHLKDLLPKLLYYAADDYPGHLVDYPTSGTVPPVRRLTGSGALTGASFCG